MHRLPDRRSPQTFLFLAPLALLLVVGLMFGRSALGSSNPHTSLTTAAVKHGNIAQPASAKAAAASQHRSSRTIHIRHHGPGRHRPKPAPTTTSTPSATPTATPTTTPTVTATTTTTTTEPAPAPTTTKPSPTTAPPSGGFQQQVLDLANAARKSNGCNTPLKLNANLNKAAQGHSDDMVAHNFFSHTGSDGRDPFTRMTDAGYHWSGAAENIAAGNTTAAATMDQWMNSPGHRANILNCGLVDLGVGYTVGQNDDYAGYWVQDFGSPA